MTTALTDLLALMERLRGTDGCPWDRVQTFASIAPHTIEEAYEVADAIEREDMAHLKEELGDLLFQVVFHAQMAREAGHFDFDAVAAAIGEKLIRRHPQLFGPPLERGGTNRLSAAQQSVVWEDIKAAERAAVARRGKAPPPASALDDVPVALPALLRAVKLSKRAARVGFDFEETSSTADKVAEELAEVRDAAREGVAAGIFEEVGDLLFAAANLARKLNVDAEAALRSANRKFERRFRGMESMAAQRGEEFQALELAAQEALWQAVKRAE